MYLRRLCCSFLLGDFIKCLDFNKASYLLVPEYTSKHALHYHGVICFQDWTDYNRLKKHYSSICGRSKFRQVGSLTEDYQLTNGMGNFSNWYDYLVKDRKKMNYSKNQIYNNLGSFRTSSRDANH